MSSSPALAKAVLVPMNGDEPETDVNQHIPVQFNPVSLKVALSNTLKADNAGGTSSAAAQHVDKSESSLTVQLVFDSSVPGEASVPGSSSAGATGGESASAANHSANSDVRALTQRVADTFMKPQDAESDRPRAPKRCRFQWGTFVFVGMVSTYNETLDFFSPEGIPLRATLALTLKEDRYQFTLGENTFNGERAAPNFASGGEQKPVSSAANSEGRKPKDWRDVALFNGIENPRLSPRAGIAVPKLKAKASITASVGFSVGASAELGTDIPGAFEFKKG